MVGITTTVNFVVQNFQKMRPVRFESAMQLQIIIIGFVMIVSRTSRRFLDGKRWSAFEVDHLRGGARDKKGSAYTDSNQFQKAEYSYMHAMSSSAWNKTDVQK